MHIDLIPLDIENPDQVGMMYKIRKAPEVSCWLHQPPPECFAKHVLYLSRMDGRRKFFCIYRDDVMVGYCQLSISEDIELGWALAPEYQGMGIGRPAVLQLIAEAKRCNQNFTQKKKIVLYVKEGNKRAISLYNKHGFRYIDGMLGVMKMEIR